MKPLPRRDHYELWDLAVSRKYRQSQVPTLLLEKALSYLCEAGAQFVRGYTLSIEPYVSAYKSRGFKPVRRILRIDWDLGDELPLLQTRKDICIKKAVAYDPEKIADILVKSLAPFWDWYVEDYGGPEEFAKHSKEWVTRLRCYVAELEKEVVGVTGFSIGKGKMGRFLGVMVLPEHRTERIGSTLVQAALKEAKEAGLKSLRVFTMAFLDHLAPGAILYLKSGGRIAAEYLQLEAK